MFYLLLAVLLCLLVPWLPVWMYRRLPRRPADPLPEGQLQQLAAQLQHDRPGEVAEVVAVEEEPASTDIIPPQGPASRVPVARPKEAEKTDPSPQVAEKKIAQGVAAPRLTIRSYRWLNFLSIPFIVGGFLALGVGWAFLLHVLAEEHARGFPPALFLFKPFVYGLIFAVPSMFLGIFTILPLMMLLLRLVMGRRLFLEYLFWDEGRLNRGALRADGIIRMLSLLALLISIPCAGFVGLAMNWYTRFTEDEIAVKPLFGFSEEKHAYGNIEQLLISSHRRVGKDIMEGPELGIRFQDGQTWRTGQTFQLPRDDIERDRLLAFLQRKTGKPIKRLRLLEDMPGW